MNTTLVKICGLTSLEDTLAAIEMGADFLGFNFYPQSSRYLSYERAQKIFEEIPSNIPKVGVFVNEEYQNIIDLVQLLEFDYLQFHGDETPEFCNAMGHPWFKAIRLTDEKSLEIIPKYETEFILVDAAVSGKYGGTGIKANWQLAKKVGEMNKKVILAGGLNPENVQAAIATVQPFAVDVTSGIESREGKKDFNKMEEFITKAKSVPVRVV
jgi:phosphoribosylanthranilate isomerase